MDSNDTKALAHLMAHARTTWAELGSLLGLSAPAAADRVRKLEELGVIKGYAALVNPEEAGCSLAALISVTLEQQEQRGQFLGMVQDLPEIMECHHVAGAEDYFLKVRCHSPRDLEDLISSRLKSLPGLKTKTTVVLSTFKETPVLPLAESEQ